MSPVTALATLCAPAHCRWARIRRRSGAPRAPLSAPRGPRLRCAASDAVAVELRDDDVLPDSLYDAVVQGGQTTATAIEAGNSRCLVEIQVPELFDSTSGNIMAQEGDQQRVWELCRFFVESLSQAMGVLPEEGACVRAVFPDAGAAAGLAQRWSGAISFSIASLNDRALLRPGDRVVVVCAPDPQGVEASQRVAAEALESGASIVLLNPRLASGDAGIGLNARRLRERFVNQFTVSYSLRPLADGTVFKRYPEAYKVFGPDAQRAGRFKLLAEQAGRPGLEDVLLLLEEDARGPAANGGGAARQESVVENLQRTMASMFRFMNSLK